MADLTQKSFEQKIALIIESIRTKATPFDDDSTEKAKARKERALADPFAFAAFYFPHYIQLRDGFERDCYKRPDAKIDWVKMGFAECHKEFWEFAKIENKFSLIAGYTESAKDTLLAKIDVIKKCVTRDMWYNVHVSMNDDLAIQKVLPIRMEFEHNERLKSDFGDLKGSVKWEENQFVLNNGVMIEGRGRDKALRSALNGTHRPDYLVINDFWDALRERNPALIKHYVKIVKQDFLERLNTPRWGAICLFNYIKKQMPEHYLLQEAPDAGYRSKIFRVLLPNPKKSAEEKEIARQCILHGFDDFSKSDWEFRHPTIEMKRKEKADKETFDRERMMRPGDDSSTKFNDDSFHYYTDNDIVGLQFVTYTAIDPSAKSVGDYKAKITLGVPVNVDYFKIFVLNAWIKQADANALVKATFDDYEIWNEKKIRLEAIGFAVLLKGYYDDEMKKRGYPLPLDLLEGQAESKDTRIERLVPMVNSGIIVFNKKQGDQLLLIEQFKAFPDKTQVRNGGIGDDGPDATSECERLIRTFPVNENDVVVKSVQKRKMRFRGRGAYG